MTRLVNFSIPVIFLLFFSRKNTPGKCSEVFGRHRRGVPKVLHCGAFGNVELSVIYCRIGQGFWNVYCVFFSSNFYEFLCVTLSDEG